jgi:hypothetical protein
MKRGFFQTLPWLGLMTWSAVAGEGARLSPPETFWGMCDASAAVAIGTNFFVVANDEDNILRIYRRHPGGMPISSIDLSRFLAVKGKSPETDIEAATMVSNRIYWITSHGRNAKGKNSPDRHRFFATDVVVDENWVKLVPVGRPYHTLLLDFALDPRLSRFGLTWASRLAPKQPGALNIEGLTAMPGGGLLLGFRNPIPGGRALLLPLLNPEALIQGQSAKFGEAIQIGLGGLGVRSLGYENGRYLIIAGHSGAQGKSRLYTWPGPGTDASLVESVDFSGLNPEGMAFETVDGHREYFILSDDGTMKVQGIDCKRLTDPAQRRFRGYALRFD